MILIFGGTTEGRLAVDVCEQSGQTFYYSTKTSGQAIDMRHGIRLSGAMTAHDISIFCKRNDIRCIIDAAHPFATGLHQSIGSTGLPVIRLQRIFAHPAKGVIYCDDYEQAIRDMEKADINCLLALSGVNTISKLKAYWTRHHTLFRILHKEESLEQAQKEGVDPHDLLFYADTDILPTEEEEMDLMKETGCDAIITKESGSTGGFDAKVKAAQALGIKVFVVRHPRLPAQWYYVTGRHGLRRAIESIVPSFFPLKTGLTTGACATAAVKAALLSSLYDEEVEEISFSLPDGELLSIPVMLNGKGSASVRKEDNDDPDVTRGCLITATVDVMTATDRHHGGINGGKPSDEQKIRFLPGKGVGMVTLPGLGLPIGEPAVNPVPRQMIIHEIKQLTERDVDVTISVEHGEELARKTFNPRVGVIGGISILGTSGIVHPLSNEAFISSIRREMEVAWAIGHREIGLVAGMKSEKALNRIHKIRCIHYGNFVGESLKAAYNIGFRKVTLAIMIGKAVKLAEGHLDTHSHKVTMNKDFLKEIAKRLGIATDAINNISMARELWGVMPSAFFNEITSLCLKHCRAVFPDGELNLQLICDIQSS